MHYSVGLWLSSVRPSPSPLILVWCGAIRFPPQLATVPWCDGRRFPTAMHSAPPPAILRRLAPSPRSASWIAGCPGSPPMRRCPCIPLPFLRTPTGQSSYSSTAVDSRKEVGTRSGITDRISPEMAPFLCRSITASASPGSFPLLVNHFPRISLGITPATRRAHTSGVPRMCCAHCVGCSAISPRSAVTRKT